MTDDEHSMSDKTGTRGKRMSAARKVIRDSTIVAALAAGDRVKDVAERFEMTPTHVRRIQRTFEARPTQLDEQPMVIVENAIRRYEEQMRGFMAVAEDTLDRAPAVAIAAMKGYADTNERLMNALAALGKLPSNLELFRAEGEIFRLGEGMLERLEAVMAGDLTVEEAYAWMDRAVRAREPLSQLEEGVTRDG